MIRTALLLSIVALTSLACQQPADDATDAPASEPTASDSSSEAEPAVEYEPAYPTDVSSEELSQDDVAQQEATHSHDGGEEHSHDEGDHDHGDGDDHDHDGEDHDGNHR